MKTPPRDEIGQLYHAPKSTVLTGVILGQQVRCIPRGLDDDPYLAYHVRLKLEPLPVPGVDK